MKRITLSVFLYVSLISFVFSQNAGNYPQGHFTKIVEYNFMQDGVYNIKSKGDIEKIFFGDFNALTEFCYDPSSEGKSCIPSGFRIFRDSKDRSFIIEVKYVSNYREASKEASTEAKKVQGRQLLNIPTELLDSLPGDVFSQIQDYNRNISGNKFYLKMYYAELPKHFKVEIKSIHISDQFAEKLYSKMVSLINNFRAKGIPPMISDGYSVTFRTVVDDEVWSLGIHMPVGDAKILTDLCIQIINDSKADQLDESKYLSVLNNFGNQ